MAMGDQVFCIAATAASGRAELALLSSGHRRLTKRDPLRGSEVLSEAARGGGTDAGAVAPLLFDDHFPSDQSFAHLIKEIQYGRSSDRPRVLRPHVVQCRRGELTH